MLLDAHGWSVDELADRAGLSRGTVYKYLSRERSPMMQKAAQIADAFGVPLTEMMQPMGGAGLSDRVRLLRLFDAADPSGRETVMRVAEAQAQFHPAGSAG